MNQSQWENLALGLAAVAAVVAVFVLAVAVVAVAVFVLAVAVVAVVAVANPRLSCAISFIVIAISVVSLFFTLPTALHPPQTIKVICQVTTTHSPIILIHNSTTTTITGQTVTNQTMTEIATKVSCP